MICGPEMIVVEGRTETTMTTYGFFSEKVKVRDCWILWVTWSVFVILGRID